MTDSTEKRIAKWLAGIVAAIAASLVVAASVAIAGVWREQEVHKATIERHEMTLNQMLVDAKANADAHSVIREAQAVQTAKLDMILNRMDQRKEVKP